MVQGCVFIATSLDGFIARSDGRIDWLEAQNARVPPGEDFGFKAFFDSVDVLVMGRKTFETALGFPSWPYESKRVVVLSHSWSQLPPSAPPSASLSQESPETLFRRLSSEGVRRVYVDGGQTIRAFLDAGLIHELTVTLIPVLIGTGIPLFGPNVHGKDVEWALRGTKEASCGFVQLRYVKPLIGGGSANAGGRSGMARVTERVTWEPTQFERSRLL